MTESTTSSVLRLSVEDVPPKPHKPRLVEPSNLTPPQSSTAPITPSPTISSTLDVVVTAFTGLGYALSARGLLLLSLVFSFVLAVMAMRDQTYMALGILIAGSVFTVLPVAFLEVRRRSQ